MKQTLMALAIVVALPYACAPLYEFQEPGPFAGSAFLNPYAGLRATWQRANLHAHGRPWGSLTNGSQTSTVVASAYRSKGYSVAGISDYQSIAALKGVPTIPIYEHGYNVKKRHQLAIGARRVDWFDFPLWQSLSNRQLVIDRVGRTADLVALAHPPSRDAYTPEDLRRLSGYHLLEVVNGPHGSEETWDAALSSGHAVWALANDDTHDIADPSRTAVAWNMINADSPSTSNVIDALRAGRTYAVSRANEIASAPETVLTGIDFSDRTLLVTCAGEPSTFIFVGQNGHIRKTVKDATNAAYTFDHDDTYIRTVIRSPRTIMYLNPVLRYDGVRLPSTAASVNVSGTWLQRGLFLMAAVTLVLIYRKRRAGILGALPHAVLPRDDRKTA